MSKLTLTILSPGRSTTPPVGGVFGSEVVKSSAWRMTLPIRLQAEATYIPANDPPLKADESTLDCIAKALA